MEKILRDNKGYNIDRQVGFSIAMNLFMQAEML